MKRWQGSCIGAFLVLLIGGGTGHFTELTCTYSDGSQKAFGNEEVGLKGLAASFTVAGICGGLVVLFFMSIAAIVGARLVKPKTNP